MAEQRFTIQQFARLVAAFSEVMPAGEATELASAVVTEWEARHALTPSADLPACRDEDPAHATTLAAAYPDPPEYQHPEDEEGARLAERESYIGTWSNQDVTKRETRDGL